MKSILKGLDLRVEKYPAYLLFSILLVISFIILAVDYIPYVDAINHLARYYILNQVLFHANGTSYQASFELLPTSYILIDVFAATALNFISVSSLGKILALFATTLPVLGTYQLLKTVNPDNKQWVVGAGLLSFNWYFFYGFLNYLIGLGFALLFLSWWWKRREEVNGKIILITAVTAIILLLTHMTSLAIVLVVTWTYGGLNLIYFFQNKIDFICLKKIWVIPITLFASGIVLFVYTRVELSGLLPIEDGGVFTQFRSPVDKLKQFASPLYSFSLLQASLMFAGWFICAAYISYEFLKTPKLDGFALSSIFFVLLFLLFPAVAFGAYDADVRFLPAALFLFLVIPSTPQAAGKMKGYVTGFAFILFLVHSYVIFISVKKIETNLDDYAKVITLLPKGSAVAVFVTKKVNGRVDYYRHFNFWHTINNSGITNGLFYRESIGSHMGHFVVSKNIYDLPEVFDGDSGSEIQWGLLNKQYDYFIVAGDPGVIKNAVDTNGVLEKRINEIYLYKVKGEH